MPHLPSVEHIDCLGKHSGPVIYGNKGVVIYRYIKTTVESTVQSVSSFNAK